MSNVTAKVKLHYKQESGDGSAVRLDFCPDYADGRNKEWAVATPSLSLSMNVRSDVAEKFCLGDSYTLTFEKEASNGHETG